MEQRRFSSPREEALEIALQTRKAILEGKRDTASVLRACLVIADNLNKADEKKWITSELSGYVKSKEIPQYRKVNCPHHDKWGNAIDFQILNVVYDIHSLYGVLQSKPSHMSISLDDKTVLILQDMDIRSLLHKVTDVCLSFLDNIITELQYGGMVEYLMEEIRKNTDEKLIKLNPKLNDEIQSLYLNLTSTNPADWNKVAHSCRKILKILADKIFPPRKEQYIMKDKNTLEVDDPHFFNRICAFLDQKTSSDERKFLMTEIGCLESYLRQILELDQMGEHKPSIEKYHADMMAIHTYLIISEILRYIP